MNTPNDNTVPAANEPRWEDLPVWRGEDTKPSQPRPVSVDRFEDLPEHEQRQHDASAHRSDQLDALNAEQ
jgi:hypothetical protein